MDRWTGRVAVVTGASSGIGAAIARDLVKHGLIVVGLARRVERVEELAKELHEEKGTLHPLKVDLRNEPEILEAFAWIEKNTGGIDILINNAGGGRFDTLLDGSTEAWRQILDLNVLGLSICAREAVKSMKKKGADDGIIININSIGGHKVLSAHFSMYTASKFAVTALSEALHKELAASGSRIRVTNLSPGAVNTEFGEAAATGESKNIKLNFGVNDMLQSEDIAHAVSFILSTDTRVHIPELTIQQNFEIIVDMTN